MFDDLSGFKPSNLIVMISMRDSFSISIYNININIFTTFIFSPNRFGLFIPRVGFDNFNGFDGFKPVARDHEGLRPGTYSNQ